MPSISLFKYSSTLRSRLNTALLFSFLCVGIFTTLFFVVAFNKHQKEVLQEMHKDLASHVVDHYPFFSNGLPDITRTKHTFHDLMILGPNFEFYLLDQNGKILAYSTAPEKIKRKSVSLSPIENYLQGLDKYHLIEGNDPRSYEKDKAFSAASIHIDGKHMGYLYVILGSEIHNEIASTLFQSKILQWGLLIFISGILFWLLTTLWITGLITAPFSKLVERIKHIHQHGFPKDPEESKKVFKWFDDFNKSDMNEINQLGSIFYRTMLNLHEQNKKLVTIDELRRELLSHVSHDLRTPLASLMGYLETWQINKEQLSHQESSEYIAIAQKNAHRISKLIEQLFELAHLDSNNIQITRERFSIAELIQDVVQKFSIQANEKGINLNVTPQDSSIKVCGDIEKLDRVFTNLIENAIRHTNPGGDITIRLNQKSCGVAIEVEDNGIGIPAEDLPHVFEPHYKAGNSVRENTAHGGLGLAITKKLLELHQVSIDVYSEINRGTRFQFSLENA